MAISSPDSNNAAFSIASDFVNHTSRHLFLTGKAGTGKTTFLRHIKASSPKQIVVTAPTGVAAINAGGTTLHSMFQLPFGPFIPDNQPGFGSGQLTDSYGLLKQLRLSAAKKEVLREMELLVIDEVSMLRCDMLDALDSILRHVRKNPSLPFGGVQVLYIGDLYQLPPVVSSEEWQILKQYYQSPFFFHAKVIEQSPPLYIELKKIYRQNEQHFIELLNRVRNNEVNNADLTALNNRAVENHPESRAPGIITLTSHNRLADSINNNALDKLPGKVFAFEGEIINEFNENALPTEKTLLLKPGAQVMFIRNETGENRRFYNGKLATVSRIEETDIYLQASGESDEIKLEKETWKNIRYSYNAITDKIEEEELGSFTQFPIRLAWAITIHKSQGLTFEKAIIDAGQAFAPGQVYVALSRCVSLDGLYLSSRIYASAIQTNPTVIEFAQKEIAADTLNTLLQADKQGFVYSRLAKLFNWNKLQAIIEALMEKLENKSFPTKEDLFDLLRQTTHFLQQQQVFAERFLQQVQQLGNQQPEQASERINSAIEWFTRNLQEKIRIPLNQQIAALKGKARTKLVLATLLECENLIWKKMDQLQQAAFPELNYLPGPARYQHEQEEFTEPKKKGKPAKGSSQAESLELFRAGKDAAAIAASRGLAVSTIEGHLVQFVFTGEIAPEALLAPEKMKLIEAAIDELANNASTGAVKAKLGDDFSFTDIRVVQLYRRRLAAEINDTESN